MNFRAALRRLNRLIPPPSVEDRANERILAVLAPLSYDEKILLRDALEARLLEAKVEGKLDDDEKRQLLSDLKSAAAREKKRKRPKTSDGRTRATEQSPSTRASVRRRKERASPEKSTAPNKVTPLTVQTAPNDSTRAKRSMTNNLAKASTAAKDAIPLKVPAVPNVPIPAHEATAATRKAPHRLFFNQFPYPHPDADDPDGETRTGSRDGVEVHPAAA